MDARSNVVSTYNLTTNEFGSAAGAFDLAEGAMLGSYRISAEALGQTNEQTFEVQEYQKPEFEVTIEPSALALVGGDVMDVDVVVSYFTGQPVQEATLVFTPYVNQSYYGYFWEEASWISPGLSIPKARLTPMDITIFHSLCPLEITVIITFTIISKEIGCFRSMPATPPVRLSARALTSPSYSSNEKVHWFLQMV